MSSATFYKWRAKYGGVDAYMVARLKELEDENRRLKKWLPKFNESTSAITSRCNQGGHGKKVVKPSSRPEMALSTVMLSKAQTSQLSIRAARLAFSIFETCYRYKPKHSQRMTTLPTG